MTKVLAAQRIWLACTLSLFSFTNLKAAGQLGVREIPLQQIRNAEDAGSVLPLFGDDVRITAQYRPHSQPVLASTYFAWEVYCAFVGTYTGYPAVHIFKSTDDGHSWSPFGGVYTPGGQRLVSPSIAVTSSYVCISYTFDPSPGSLFGTVQTYRVPRSGGTGDFATLPPNPAGTSDLAGCEWDAVHLVLIYKYGPSQPEQVMVYFRSDDGGYTWGGEYTFSLDELHNSPRIWYEIGSYPEWLYVARLGGGERFAISTDGGFSWQSRYIEPVGHHDICGDGLGNIVILGYYQDVHKCVWSSNSGSSWQSYTLPSELWGYISCDWMAGYFKAAGVAYQSPAVYRVLYKSSTSPTGFSGPWEAIDDMTVQNGLQRPAVCTDVSGFGLVAWADRREGQETTYCDEESWIGIEEEPQSDPARHALYPHLHQNLPNPFTSATQVQYVLPKTANLKLEVHDNVGRVVTTLVAGHQDPGLYQVTWDGQNGAGSRVAAGVYFYKLTAGDFTSTKKMVLIR